MRGLAGPVAPGSGKSSCPPPFPSKSPCLQVPEQPWVWKQRRQSAGWRGSEARGLCLCWLPLSKRLILEQSHGRGSLVPPLNPARAPGQGAEVRGAHAPRWFWLRPLQKQSPGAEQAALDPSQRAAGSTGGSNGGWRGPNAPNSASSGAASSSRGCPGLRRGLLAVLPPRESPCLQELPLREGSLCSASP